MRKLRESQRFQKVWKSVKTVLTMVMIVTLLHYTGILAGISFVTNTALIKSGLVDIKPENDTAEKTFNYDFSIKDLSGKEISMSDYKGKVIFLNLWATWCGPCRIEMPSIQELYDKVDKEKIVFIMITLDTDENQHKVVKYINDKSFTFPVYMPSGYLPKQLQISSIPTTFVVGADGKIKMKKVGTANYASEEFEAFLKNLIESQQP